MDKESVATIASDSNNIMAFGQYISVLNKSGLVLYDVDGKEQKTLDVSISSPKHSTKNKYLALAEEKGNKIYCDSNCSSIGNICIIYYICINLRKKYCFKVCCFICMLSLASNKILIISF